MRISFQQAIDLLQAGHVVAVPTETVYGLAASLSHPQAIEAIFTLKGRPKQNPLIVHLGFPTHVYPYVHTLPPSTEALIYTFWPGPLTLVLPTKNIPSNVTAHLPTAAFRVPDHSTRALIQRTGPLVMPSANLSGRPSATSWEHVENDFGPDFPILDGPPPQHGLESTILIYQEQWTLLRLGALPASAFEPILGYIPSLAPSGPTPLCPGQLFRHYAPTAHLIPTHNFPNDLQGTILGFSDHAYPPGCSLYSFGPLHAPHIVAENLYATLRRLDNDGIKEVWLDMRFPQDGLWATIAERLMKAANPLS